MGQKRGSDRRSQSHYEAGGSDKTHRARAVPEDPDLILGATSGFSSRVEGPIRNPAWKQRGQCHDPGAETVAVKYLCTFLAVVIPHPPPRPGGEFICSQYNTKEAQETAIKDLLAGVGGSPSSAAVFCRNTSRLLFEDVSPKRYFPSSGLLLFHIPALGWRIRVLLA